MNYDRLNRLVEKYLGGTSSIAEEKELKYYFLNEEVPENLLSLKSQFLAFDEFAETELSLDFENEFWEAVHQKRPDNISLNQPEKGGGQNRWNIYSLVTGIAAALAIVLTIWMTTDIFNIKKAVNQNNNPALAYQQATDALTLLAVNFDKGISQTQQAARPLNTGFKMLNNVSLVNKGVESLQPVNNISKMKIINYNNH